MDCWQESMREGRREGRKEGRKEGRNCHICHIFSCLFPFFILFFLNLYMHVEDRFDFLFFYSQLSKSDDQRCVAGNF